MATHKYYYNTLKCNVSVLYKDFQMGGLRLLAPGIPLFITFYCHHDQIFSMFTDTAFGRQLARLIHKHERYFS